MKQKKFKELLDKQRELDEFILSKHTTPMPLPNLLQARVLALAVELGECANEVRSFKHWSKKAPSAKEVILEEYVDCLHFALSITNTIDDDISIKGIRLWEEEGVDMSDDKTTINGFFIGCIQLITSLPITTHEYAIPRMIDTLKDFWVLFGALGMLLGFSEKDVLDMYEHKYKINVERQKAGY